MTPLTRTYEEPSDEQLERFVSVLLAGEARRRGLHDVSAVYGAHMVMRSPTLKAVWLQRHREMQEAAWAADDETTGERQS